MVKSRISKFQRRDGHSGLYVRIWKAMGILSNQASKTYSLSYVNSLSKVRLNVTFLSVVYIFLGTVTGTYRGLSYSNQRKGRTNHQATLGVLNFSAMFTPGHGRKFGLVRIVNNAANSHRLNTKWLRCLSCEKLLF